MTSPKPQTPDHPTGSGLKRPALLRRLLSGLIGPDASLKIHLTLDRGRLEVRARLIGACSGD